MELEKSNLGKIVDIKILRRLFPYIKPYTKQFNILVILTFMLAVLIPARPYIVKSMIDGPIAESDFSGLINFTFFLILLLVLQAIVQYFHTFLSSWLGQFVIKDIRVTLFRHIQNLRLSYFDKTPVGRLVTRTVSDIETLAEVFSQGIAGIIADTLQLLFIIGIMFYVDWRLALIIMATLPILLLATYIFKEKIKSAFNQVRTAVSNLNSFVQEHITGMIVVQIFNSEKREFEKFKEINKQHLKANLKSVLYYSVYFPVAEVIQAVGIGMVVWYGGGEVLSERLTLGTVIMFIMFINMFFRPIRMIADRFNTLQMGIVSSTRIMDLIDKTNLVPNTGKKKIDQLYGDVVFENVWFAYNNEDWILKGMDFKIDRGQTLAMVGATGSGKSSVANLLNRFYEVNKGTIKIDGFDIQEYDLQDLRSCISVVLQDVFLFSDSVYQNITLKNPRISKQKVMDAARLVGAEDFILNLPGGLEYDVKERGATLSVGQRQLISFVRVMVHDPKLVVLDEATSSVDGETETLIQEALKRLMKGRTAVIIAHRLATVQNADNIIVLEKGEIKEQGTHEELLALNGYYSQLNKIQFKGITVS